MKEFSIFLTNENITLTAKEGERLADILNIAICKVKMPCGGNGTCKKCTILVDGKSALLCQEIVSKDITVLIPREKKVEISQENHLELQCKGKYMLCIDIGTTNIEAALIDENKNLVISLSLPNSQKSHGLDVMARINYAINNGVSDLQKLVVDDINAIIDAILDKKVTIDIKYIIIAANTVMTNILLGADISSMGFYPYSARFLDSERIKATAIGINLDTDIITVPSGAPFFGGDAVASLCTLDPTPNWILMLDLGTNLEIALVCNDSYAVTSAAAGPCMEGAGITCGMTAVDGAITHFDIVNGRKIIRGIGDNFIGLSATALVDVIANLLQIEELDYKGRLLEDCKYYLTDKVFITAADIRAFQLAKAAVRSAIDSLLKFVNVEIEDIAKCYLAGGISLGLSLTNAAISGLFPKELIGKTTCIGNGSLKGAIEFSKNQDKAKIIAKKIKFLELNNQSNFYNDYIENINFDNI